MIKTITLILVLAVSGFAESALACSCTGLPQNAEDARLWVETNDLVALVYIEETSNRDWVENGVEKSDNFARGYIVRSFKGLLKDSNIYMDLNSGSTCNAHFQLRYTYLVVAKGPEPNGRFKTSMCSMGQFWADIDEPGYKELNQLNQKIIGPTIRAIEELLD